MNTSLSVKTDLNKQLDFYSIVSDIMKNETVKEMKNYKQHYNTSTYEHCFYVSYISYKICKKLHLDYVSAARAGMVHDLFLYDWRNSRKNLNLNGFHAFIHPRIALENASKLFILNEKEKDIIAKHMWPITLPLPKYAESFVITFVDKLSAIEESFRYYNDFLTKQKLYKYAYVFLSLLILI